eukprot:12319763-Heterocapsa_arctica.AAC.1
MKAMLKLATSYFSTTPKGTSALGPSRCTELALANMLGEFVFVGSTLTIAFSRWGNGSVHRSASGSTSMIFSRSGSMASTRPSKTMSGSSPAPNVNFWGLMVMGMCG